ASGCNALAHAAAALSGPTFDPLARLYAAEAVGLLVQALPAAVGNPRDLAVRGDLLWASWLAGSAFAATGSGLHHRLCHVLGGSYGLVHADVHAVLLPHTVARDSSLDLAPLSAALGLDSADPDGAGRTLQQLARAAGAPTGLATLGLPPDRLDDAAHEAAATLGGHDPSWFRSLLDRAYHPDTTPEREGR
ncbi:MAG: maleylacetate reductase, partial [Actinomycetota bacterium]